MMIVPPIDHELPAVELRNPALPQPQENPARVEENFDHLPPPVQEENTAFGRAALRTLNAITGFAMYFYNPIYNEGPESDFSPLYYAFVTYPYNNIATPIYNRFFAQAPVGRELAAAPAADAVEGPEVVPAPMPLVDDLAVVEAEPELRTWVGFARDMFVNYAYNPARNYVAAPLYYAFGTFPYNNIVAPIANRFASRVSRHFNNDEALMNTYDEVVRNIRERQYAQRVLAGQKSHLKMMAERVEKVLSDSNLPEEARNWAAAEAATLQSASLSELYEMRKEITSYQYLADSEKANAYAVRELLAEDIDISHNYKAKLISLVPNYDQDMHNNYRERFADNIVANLGPKKGWLHGFNSSVFDRRQPGDAAREQQSLEDAKLFARGRVMQFTARAGRAFTEKTVAIARA